MPNENEVDKFFADLPTEDKTVQDIFNDNPAPTEPTEPKELEAEEGVESRKNRHHRRLEEALQRERESNIALNERIKVLAEVDKRVAQPSNDDVPAEWIALMGDSPEAQKAWKLQQNFLQQAVEKGKQEAIEALESRRRAEIEAEREAEQLIDSELERLEDTFNVDLTSNSPAARKARTEYLDLLEKISPKNESGSVSDYADFHSTFELYQKTRTTDKPDNSQRKQLADRSMQRPSGSPTASNGDVDATEKYLNSIGIKTRL